MHGQSYRKHCLMLPQFFSSDHTSTLPPDLPLYPHVAPEMPVHGAASVPGAIEGACRDDDAQMATVSNATYARHSLSAVSDHPQEQYEEIPGAFVSSLTASPCIFTT